MPKYDPSPNHAVTAVALSSIVFRYAPLFVGGGGGGAASVYKTTSDSAQSVLLGFRCS